MDSLNSLDNAVRRKFKKVFERLSDDYIIRTPVLNDSKVAHIVVEGPNQSWLFIGVHELIPSVSELEMFLNFNAILSEMSFQKLNYLSVCDVGESLFSKKDSSLNHVSVIEKAEFFSQGDKFIIDSLVAVKNESHFWLKKNLVTESLINASCTTRRNTISHDSSVKLQEFFLDYDQELATKYDILSDSQSSEMEDGFSVRLINGVAGCGKTLILINRAILYSKKYPNRKTLLLIHNKPVTEDIKFKFDNYLGGQPENLKIQTFHSHAFAQQRKISGHFDALMTDAKKKPFIEKIFTDDNQAYQALTLSDSQIWSELEYINEFLIQDKEYYLSYDRQGRGFSLSKWQRENIWQLYELSKELMSCPRNGYLPSLYIRNLCLFDDVNVDRYDHILIDEAQFFFPSWLELVKKSINENGQLFLCADPNQGFLKSRLSWKSVGLNVRGRTKKLSYSYRTTYEIMVAANALLETLSEDSEDFIQPDLNNMTRGCKPQVVYTSTLQDEQKRFVNEINYCINDGEIPLQQIIVLCSDAYNPWSLKKILEAKLGKGSVVNCNHRDDLENNLGDKIRIMTINSCTGMEAGIIFVLGVGGLLDKENSLDLMMKRKM